MIIFFYGPESFLKKRKLQELKDRFIKEIDVESNSLEVLDGQTIDLKTLNEKINTGSLFATKRMIIINQIFKNKKSKIFSELATYLVKIANEDDKIIVFVDDELNTKKTPLTTEQKKLFNFLIKQKFIQEFKPLTNAGLMNFIKKEANSYHKEISPSAALELIKKTGSDLWLISQSIKKAALSQEEKIISLETINATATEIFNEDIFSLTDAISAKNKKLALKILEEQYAAGLEDEGIIAMLIRQFKILILIMEANKNGIRPDKIASELKIHPFVTKKGLMQIKNFRLEQLKQSLNDLISLDFANKTGATNIKLELTLFLTSL